jgi:hypothetical protein
METVHGRAVARKCSMDRVVLIDGLSACGAMQPAALTRSIVVSRSTVSTSNPIRDAQLGESLLLIPRRNPRSVNASAMRISPTKMVRSKTCANQPLVGKVEANVRANVASLRTVRRPRRPARSLSSDVPRGLTLEPARTPDGNRQIWKISGRCGLQPYGRTGRRCRSGFERVATPTGFEPVLPA